MVAALTSGKTLTIEDTEHNVSWTMAGSDSMGSYTNTNKLDTTITPVPDGENKQLRLDFGHEGVLPYASTIRCYFGTEYAGQTVSVENWNYDVMPPEFVEAIDNVVVDADGYVEFTITHCSDWVMTVTCEITFNANGGSIAGGSTLVKTVNYKSAVGTIADPERLGYAFAGWNPAFDSVAPVTADATYTAQWTINQYTATINLSDGSVASTPAGWTLNNGVYTKDFDYQTAKATIVEDFGTITREGYTLTAMNSNIDPMNSNIDPMGVEGMIITAQWTVNQYEAFVDLDGGTVASVPTGWVLNEGMYRKNFDYGTAANVIIADFGSTAENTTKVGYTFDEMFYPAPVMGTAGFPLLALWDANTYTVRFNANGGNGSMENQAFTYGVAQNLTDNAFTSDTAAFNGWSTTATGDVVYGDGYNALNLTAENNAIIDLYAVWGPYNIVVNITLDGNAYEGLTVTAKKNDAGEAFALVYEGNGNYACRSGIEVSSSYTVYVGKDNAGTVATNAQGSGSASIAYFTVTFNTNGGTPAVDPARVKAGSLVTEPQDITKTGNELTGWKNVNTDWNFGVSTVTGTTTLTAQWTPATYDVTLHANEGNIVSGNVTSYTYGTGAALPTEVAKLGCNFGGWFDNSGLTGTAVTSITATDDGDKEYWAKWNLVTYTLTFDADGGEPVQRMEYTVQSATFDLPTTTM